ncbi:hypothetical protein A1D22_05515 [Pasteurellaceae bacterium LFhippo2]|nr:hypothetical protein [Pasteurellaceae bacterium LFhippo2]
MSSKARIVSAIAAGAAAVGIGATATGSSAAAITGGLAAIGSIFGGGMVAGIATVAVTPLAIGAAAYGLWKWLS